MAPPTTSARRSYAAQLFDALEDVKGQDKARRQIAVLMERQRLVAAGRLPSASGCILAGRTGTGKSMLARLACERSGLPYAEINATQYTDKGYVGLDLSQMFLPLIQSAARIYDHQRAGISLDSVNVGDVFARDGQELAQIVHLAESGVVFVDEFDKWLVQGMDQSGRNVGKKLQAELLKMIEGSVEYVSPIQDHIGAQFNTTKTFFICAGVFNGLPEAVAQRNRQSPEWAAGDGWLDLAMPADFVKLGVLPELAGRLSAHVYMKNLTPDALATILMAPGGLMDEYATRFNEAGARWRVHESGARAIADRAISRGTGARGAEHAAWEIFSEALFEASGREDVVGVYFEAGNQQAWLGVA